ncbi:phosphate acyltransferase [Sinanaerobacter chloroacetimidivorans]|jgi:phosphate acetyltransferase|uniref:Phosphate acetyltransferase n=1 Tax=Sinanaerobacter chloroacetimidivorans TaxID=2818044 RepID=A0A8J8AZU7_9FIRM|nr:phosphate acyltransferase [Sinanaerobacter chloroacetimidivorans]MBR0596903.1 phosphate acetyltransferase [Sinanaerobacter chloroacetimidivorans]
MDLVSRLKAEAKKNVKTIVFPEGENPAIIQAAVKMQKEGLADPILIGSVQRIKEIMKDLLLKNDPVMKDTIKDLAAKGLAVKELVTKDLVIIDPVKNELLPDYIGKYCEERKMPEAAGKRIISQPLYFAAMMVKEGAAMGMVAGIDHPTEEVIMASELIFGLQENISVPSSFYLLEIPNWEGAQGNMIIFSDPSMNPDPNAAELADIACTTAHSARTLLGWEPKAALLSFSTKGSGDHPCVTKIQNAVELLKQRNCDFLFDGELQADAAINPAIGKKKTGGAGQVAGFANILIFPDLNACNISSKLVQQMAGAKCYGPILQGFRFPVSDLSRGASVDDIIGSTLLTAAAK